MDTIGNKPIPGLREDGSITSSDFRVSSRLSHHRPPLWSRKPRATTTADRRRRELHHTTGKSAFENGTFDIHFTPRPAALMVSIETDRAESRTRGVSARPCAQARIPRVARPVNAGPESPVMTKVCRASSAGELEANTISSLGNSPLNCAALCV
jgi:hypothetical protein